MVLALVLQSWAFETVEESTSNKHHRHHHKGDAAHHKGGHHHHHHKGHHHHHHKHHNVTAEHQPSKAAAKTVPAAKPAVATKKPVAAPKVSRDEQLVEKMKALELRLGQKKKSHAAAMQKGHLLVSGPLPVDFADLFAQGVSQALTTDAKKVKVTKTTPVADQPGVYGVDFEAPPKVVKEVEQESTDPESKLANGHLHQFLVAKGEDDDEAKEASSKPPPAPSTEEETPATPVEEKGIDIDTAMPYGDLEPFGREDTAQELTEDSVKESDEMVDQLERAEVAEEKRAVFRALTRLRGAAITSFDGVARSQTGNIDEYNKIHKWRETHPLHHLADEESDITKWAFPDNADF